jgi:preprotein translocase subunit SecF
MLRLAAIIYVLVATALAGAAVTAMLTIGRVSASQISLAALAGAVIAIPAAWLIAKSILAQIGGGRR